MTADRQTARAGAPNAPGETGTETAEEGPRRLDHGPRGRRPDPEPASRPSEAAPEALRPEATAEAETGGPSLLARLFRRPSGPDEAEGIDSLSHDGREMLLNVRRLGEMRVIDVMVPRADISAVDADSDFAEVVEAFRRTRHTRLPVYRETLDDPLGFVHLKDLALGEGHGLGAQGGDGGAPRNGFHLRAMLRPMLYVPPSMPADALLRKMQGGRTHMALVIDEYGGVDGLVTIEDVLEQIVGEIEDEHETAEAHAFREEAPGVYLASARVELPEFEAAAGVDLLADDLDEDVDTLGGLVFMLADRIPERGEVISHPDGHEFEVLDADPRRIKRLRVRLHRPAGEGDGARQGA